MDHRQDLATLYTALRLAKVNLSEISDTLPDEVRRDVIEASRSVDEAAQTLGKVIDPQNVSITSKK